MFHGDIALQGLKLTEMPGAIVDSLDRFQALTITNTPPCTKMGQRHAAYGVVSSHYEIVEQALLLAS
jgi:hemoglobin-like flavoprotein